MAACVLPHLHTPWGDFTVRRSALLSAAVTTALTAGLVGSSVLAHAEDPPGDGPVLVAATGDARHPGMLFVEARSGSPLTGISVHFFPADSAEGTPEAGSTDDFSPPVAGQSPAGAWSAPVHLPDLGVYRMTVDLQDASGAVVTGLAPTGLLYYEPVLTVPDLSATPAAPDYLHQKVTITGTLVAEDPRDFGAPSPLAGEDLYIDTWHGTLGARTGTDGRFTVSVVPTEHAMYITAHPLPDPAYPGGLLLPSVERQVFTLKAPTRLSISTHAIDLRQGTSTSVTGRAEIQTSAGWQPLPNTEVGFFSRYAGIADATTDSHGDYVMHVPSTIPAIGGEVYLGNGGLPFQQMSSQPLSLHIAYTTYIEMSASLDERSKLHISGWVNYSDPRAEWPAGPTVTVQYSKDGRTGWKSVSTIPVKLLHNRPSAPEAFSRSFTAPSNGYWRARFNGNPDLASATTPATHLRRYATRIVGFNASPEPVRRGGLIHLTGTMQYRPGTTWKVVDLPPALYFRPRGATTYRYVADLGADRYGRISGWANATRDGTWAVAFDRETGDRYLNSPLVSDYVDVR